ncbi:beta-1,3-galactosyl-O-glycosyl-glycoprotein beta-1,6-N-acetylglucosaminyltransferase-like [Pristis pectinata]|uniref:beta-1,3-galactosyl-O-glycosyl-glycoprotein beta-1,6-N-acetylglucosaminyltransferase-like n=1 Tax=Pristis pectinata TaxID=685728 RepID=UPI00223CD8F2|nr:beta-1,3-galactosyl-O-glycosyl-glycoprotein beta-1,6-N-acetylglucosaminyltransferase-like [Pristis pectinata]XP_051893732.1 beta-1,3-galactosyl-O-glycosyl-glycoprotein beta-1,6-N-acetylglucosaminyltransferase-like [Pristis pectinata]XP_051893733.1 beta-1,3-galactosyl-O-glycosyl-glycoprotein beta-1,6-N-acetylglucosaminyltransferase-like [Pristis pectinata]
MIWKCKRYLRQSCLTLALSCVICLLLKIFAREGLISNGRNCFLEKFQHSLGNGCLPTTGPCNKKCSELEVSTESLYGVNCTAVLQGEVNAIKRSQLLKEQYKATRYTDSYFTNITCNCENFIRNRKYITVPLSENEKQFPIAYSIVIHERADQFERLLRTIFAPQNIYCVHVDDKSSTSFKTAIRSIASCFPNVFIARRLENLVYGSWSRVQADLNCMEELLARHLTWKYFINLCGMDFPTKTNSEIVRKLQELKGRNNLESEVASEKKQVRWKYHFEVINGKMVQTKKVKKPSFTSIFSGSAYMVVSRPFVEHIFKDPKVKQLIEWSKDTYSPDEFIWATLQRMPGVPGSEPSHPKYDVSDMRSVARLVKWKYFEGDMTRGKPYPWCTGAHRRSVCIYGAGDLNWILQQHHLFANKFDIDVDPIALQCLEQYIRQKTLVGCTP